MATGGGDFGYDDPELDFKIDNEPYDDEEGGTTGAFQPGTASTPYQPGAPYHGGEENEMHEQSGLPSYDEREPLLGPPGEAELERRFRALREDSLTGIIDTTKMMDTSVNPLSEEDREKQIQNVKRLIKAEYPNAKLDGLVINFSKKRPMDIVVFGPKGGEYKVVLNDGSALQKSFLNLSYVKKALGPPAEQIITQQSSHLEARQKELSEGKDALLNLGQNIKIKVKGAQNIDERINKERALVAQLKEGQGNEEEIKRKEWLIKNLETDAKIKKKEVEHLKEARKKMVQEEIPQLETSVSEIEQKRNSIEENLYSTKTFDVLKEQESRLQRLNEEDQAIIQDEMAPSFDKEAAEERVAARNEELARLQTRIAEREAAMPLRERVDGRVYLYCCRRHNRRCCWGNHQRFENHGQTIGKWP